MILENGTIRTLDPSLPLARSLAIAGDRIAGGVGTHETALASPDVVDLGGRCVLPGFTDSHVHFPTWALAQRQAKLDGCASLAEGLDRIRAGGWKRGYGWRDAEWPDGPPTRQALDAISNEPVAMWSKDYHSLWLNSAALALAGGDLDVEGGVVERDADGEPTGVLREESAWRFKDKHLAVPPDEYVDAMRAGVKLAHARGVTCVHDKDGWPIGVHAIGDRANRDALDAFESTRELWQPLGLRQRIEHAQCLAPEDVGRFAEIGVAASVQFTHAPSDEELAKRFWPDKLGGVYSFRSLLESGALLANGSDAPVEELDPWAGVLAAVLRHWREDQRLTVEEALHAICVAPAWLSHDERVRGTLLPGRAADLVVLDRDPLSIEPDELPEVQVVATMVAGRWVHNPPPWG